MASIFDDGTWPDMGDSSTAETLWFESIDLRAEEPTDEQLTELAKEVNSYLGFWAAA